MRGAELIVLTDDEDEEYPIGLQAPQASPGQA